MDVAQVLGELRKNPALCLKDMGPWIQAGQEAQPHPAALDAAIPSLPHPLQPMVGIQEWFYDLPGDSVAGPSKRDWFAPLTVMCFLAAQRLLSGPRKSIFFVGRRCWPSLTLLHLVMPFGQWQTGGIFIDPPTVALRFWVIEQVLRCPAVAAVVADAGECTPVGSRRLQLAAEAGGGYGLLARPVWEVQASSAARQRWMVKPEPTDEKFPRWRLQLNRGQGPMAASDHPGAWLAEWRWHNNGADGSRLEPCCFISV